MTQPLTIELEDAELLRAIDATLALLEQPADLMRRIGEQLELNVALRFETKTDPEGQPWAPLSPVTKEIYESDWFIAKNPAFKGGIPGSLLQRTNQLRNSLTHNVGDSWVEIGTNRQTQNQRWQVGLLHEFGTAKMPRRGLLTADPKSGRLGAEDQADVLAIVNGAIGAAWA